MLDKSQGDPRFKEALQNALLSFRCVLDADIENFLHEKVFEFFDRKLCSVYFFLNEDDFNRGKLKIEAYFTLSHKSIIASDNDLSKSKIQKVTGFKSSRTLDFVLIGHLGKNIERNKSGKLIKSKINGHEILDRAFEVISSAADLIPCRCALIECSNDPNVKRFYKSYGFSFFQKDGIHNQYTKLL